jgi:hypothetical protein
MKRVCLRGSKIPDPPHSVQVHVVLDQGRFSSSSREASNNSQAVTPLSFNERERCSICKYAFTRLKRSYSWGETMTPTGLPRRVMVMGSSPTSSSHRERWLCASEIVMSNSTAFCTEAY